MRPNNRLKDVLWSRYAEREAKVLRPSFDEAAYLVVDDGVADDDDDARHVVSHERHRDHELRVLVR